MSNTCWAVSCSKPGMVAYFVLSDMAKLLWGPQVFHFFPANHPSAIINDGFKFMVLITITIKILIGIRHINSSWRLNPSTNESRTIAVPSHHVQSYDGCLHTVEVSSGGVYAYPLPYIEFGHFRRLLRMSTENHSKSYNHNQNGQRNPQRR